MVQILFLVIEYEDENEDERDSRFHMHRPRRRPRTRSSTLGTLLILGILGTSNSIQGFLGGFLHLGIIVPI
jgi:hypothetical protein